MGLVIGLIKCVILECALKPAIGPMLAAGLGSDWPIQLPETSKAQTPSFD